MNTSLIPTSCAPALQTGKGYSDVATGAAWSTSGDTSTRLHCCPRRGTTTTLQAGRGPRGTRSSRRPHLAQNRVQTEEVQPSPTEARKQQQFDAVRRWFEDDWMRIDSKLRTSIVE